MSKATLAEGETGTRIVMGRWAYGPPFNGAYCLHIEGVAVLALRGRDDAYMVLAELACGALGLKSKDGETLKAMLDRLCVKEWPGLRPHR